MWKGGRPAAVLLRCLRVCMCVEMSKLCEYGARLFIMCKALSVHTLRILPAANAFDLALKIQSSMLLQVQAAAFLVFCLMHKWLRRAQFAFDVVIF